LAFVGRSDGLGDEVLGEAHTMAAGGRIIFP
jgi:hypothetical protein